MVKLIRLMNKLWPEESWLLRLATKTYQLGMFVEFYPDRWYPQDGKPEKGFICEIALGSSRSFIYIISQSDKRDNVRCVSAERIIRVIG